MPGTPLADLRSPLRSLRTHCSVDALVRRVVPAIIIAMIIAVDAPPATALPDQDVTIEVPSTSVAEPAAVVEGQGEASDSGWLLRLNELRKTAKLPAVVEAPVWSAGCAQHAEYLVRNQTSGHYQTPGNPWYTPEGADCGRSGNVISGRMSAGAAPYQPNAMVDAWMTAPFHGLGFVNPGLSAVAFGQHEEVSDGLRSWAATLDIMRGLEPVQQAQYPVMWPADGASTWLTRYAGYENPDPLTGCAGYAGEAGLPILLLTGNGSGDPRVTSSQVLQNGQPVEHCVLTETTYTNPNPGSQQLARSVMDFQDALIIIPRAPLQAGATIGVGVTLTTGHYGWGFSIQ